MKMVKFFLQHFWMFHDVVVFGQMCATMWYPGMRTASFFNIQHVATRRNKGWINVRSMWDCEICCVEMLRSFGRNTEMLGR